MVQSEVELLDVNEAAEVLRLRPSTVRSWILGKRIAYCKVGRRVFLRRSDLDKIINDSVVPPEASRLQ